MTTKSILILEDDLETLEFLLRILKEISNENEVDFNTVVLSDYEKTEVYINNHPEIIYDIVLLDRDCFKGGSFHVLKLDRFNKENIISISSIPQYNDDAFKLGISRSVFKNFQDLEGFANKVKLQLLEILEL